MIYEPKMGIRVGAFIIDMFFLGLISQALIQYGIGVEYDLGFGVVVRDLMYWQSTLLYLLYFVTFAIVNNGKTIGKMVTGMSIKSGIQHDLSRQKLIQREVIKSILMPISFISFIVTFFNMDKKSIHDHIVDSIVVKGIITRVEDPFNVLENDVLSETKPPIHKEEEENQPKPEVKTQIRKRKIRRFNQVDQIVTEEVEVKPLTPVNTLIPESKEEKERDPFDIFKE